MNVAHVLHQAVTEMTARRQSVSAAVDTDTEQTMETTPGRLAIRFIRPDLTNNYVDDALQMTAACGRAGYEVDPGELVIELDPRREAPLTTVLNALARTGADAIAVPDLEHIDGIDRAIRHRVPIITATPERQLAACENCARVASSAEASPAGAPA